MISPLRQSDCPLVAALAARVARAGVALHTPGHRQGGWVSPAIAQLLGPTAWQADLPELPEFGDLFATMGPLAQAQQLAAEAFGAEQTWFLVNGSTSGVVDYLLATCGPGDKVVLPRNVHRSAIAGLVLTGAVPIFVSPTYDPLADIAHSVPLATIDAALQTHPDAKAVLLVSPTYYGVCGAVAAIAQRCHHHQIPLIVDAAHGAHFGIHPDLPPSALQQGADLVVQSTHKTLAALNQAAMLHAQGPQIDRQRVQQAIQMVQSTSPNYLLLASLDAARQQWVTQGAADWERALHLAATTRSRLAALPHLDLLTPPPTPQPGWTTCDRTRLTLLLTQLALDGFTLDARLSEAFGITVELPAQRHALLLISPGNTAAELERLVGAVSQILTTTPVRTLPPLPAWSAPSVYPAPPCTPREAFFAKPVTCPIDQAVGRVSAELLCPYPPGIPLLLPGERVTAGAIAQLRDILAAGGVLSGPSDATLTTLRVLADS